MLFTRMNAAATPPVSRGSPHRQKMSSGDRYMPPPVPVIPAIRPITPPLAPATSSGGSRRGRVVADREDADPGRWVVHGITAFRPILYACR